MIDKVDVLLKQWRQSSFEWGQSDCMLSIGDYIHQHGGKNIAALFRGKYDDQKGAHAHMSNAGGAAALIDATGLERVAEPCRGDIVVIMGGSVAGVHTGHSVAVRRERGVSDIDLRLVKIDAAWRMP